MLDHLKVSCAGLLALASFSAARAGEQWHVLGPDQVGLEITSTIGGGSVSQSAEQTLTFTFDEPVNGFDTFDVFVTGGTKGTFTPISDTVFTLGVSGTGGTVTVSAAAAAAVSAASGAPSAAASFSNFYQDTWTLTLQDFPTTVTMELIRIPAGTFTMGLPEDESSLGTHENSRDVTIGQDFYLGKTEVTQAQWLALQAFPSNQNYQGPEVPVGGVSWNDVQSWLSSLDAVIAKPVAVSLPTGAEWEYACRAGTTTRFSFGDGQSSDDECATGGGREDNMWYCGNNIVDGPKPVGQKSANPWGLYDMHGNIWPPLSIQFRGFELV